MALPGLLAGLLVAALQAPFQGVVSGSYYDNAGKPAMDYTQTIKGRRMRMDMNVGGMDMSSLFDADANTITSLMHTQRMYMVMNLTKMAGTPGNTATTPKITATGQSETIAGLRCDHYLVGDKQDIDICAAKGLGFGVPQSRSPMGRGQPGVPVEYAQLAREFKDGFFPMKMEQIEGGRRRLVLLVRTVERKTVPDATFARPAGYTEMKIPGMQ